MRYVIIANPASGHGRGARMAHDVDAMLRAAGADSRVCPTTARGEAESIAREVIDERPATTNGRVCLVACGGDGTIQEVVNAICAGPPGAAVLGVAPGGRCNDFAAAFGIRRDPEDVARVLLGGRTRPIDLGRINDRYFCTVAAMGFDAAVSRYVNDMMMPLTGTAAYVYGTLQMLSRYRPVEVRLSCDASTYEGPLFLAASANTSSYGGRMKIAPQASPHDGLLDLCQVSVLSRLRVVRLLHRVLSGRHVGLPEVRLRRTRCLTIEAAEPQEVWADGEFVAQTPVTIEAVPNALEMMVPA